MKLEPKAPSSSARAGWSRCSPEVRDSALPIPSRRGRRRQPRARPRQVSGYPQTDLGYNAHVAVPTGALGFAEAAEAADAELIAIDPNFIDDSWRLPDLLGQPEGGLPDGGHPGAPRRPARPRGQARFELGELPQRPSSWSLPSETKLLQVADRSRTFASLGVRPMSTDRAGRLREEGFGACWHRSPGGPGSPFESDLPAAEPALALALNGPSAGRSRPREPWATCPAWTRSGAWPM